MIKRHYQKHMSITSSYPCLPMKSNRKHFSIRFYHRQPKLIRRYCIQDCLYTKALAENWIRIFFESYDFYPARWLLAGYMAEKVLIANNINIPYFSKISYPIQKQARACFYGGREDGCFNSVPLDVNLDGIYYA